MIAPLVGYFLGLLAASTQPGWEDNARLGGAAVLIAVGVFGFIARVAGRR